MANSAEMERERKHLAQVEQCIHDGRQRLQSMKVAAQRARASSMDTTHVLRAIECIMQSLDALSRTRRIVRAALGLPPE